MVVDNRTPNICQRCGREMDQGWSFCAFCGATSPSIYVPLPNAPPDFPRTPSPPKEFLEGKFRSLEPHDVMKTVRWRKTRRRLIRLSLLYFTVLFLIGTGVFWILSLLGVVPGYLAAIFGAVFAVLGVLFSFFQWVLPYTSSKSSN